jgi:uncharacterized protein (DUF1778 family)
MATARTPFSRATSTARSPRDERLGFRVSKESSELIHKAAKMADRSVTDFCLSAAVRAARETVERHEQLELSARDRAVFFEVLMSPPEPNDRLVRAATASKARIRP